MSDVDAIAHNAVEDVLSAHPHQRALMTATARCALTVLARLTSDEMAADAAFLLWRHHRERAARAPRRAGSQR